MQILNEPGASPISYFFFVHCKSVLECISKALWTSEGTGVPCYSFWNLPLDVGTFRLWDFGTFGLLDFGTFGSLGLWDFVTL